MTAAALLERVKTWFGGKGGNGDGDDADSPALGPARDAGHGDPLSRSAAIAAVTASARDLATGDAEIPGAPAGQAHPRAPAGQASAGAPVAGSCAPLNPPAAADLRHSARPGGSSTFRPPPRILDNPPAAADLRQSIDPLDPAWIESLEELPQRLAESAAESAAGVQRLREIGGELEGHRLATRTIAASVRRLPDIALGQAQLTRETNKCLERQALVLESVLDGITGLRAALRTVEESSRRHLKAISVLESGHRQVLFEYQVMFQRAHRQVGHLAALAIALAATAIGGVGYALYLALVAVP
jgi:hypothetical protein